MVHQDPEFSMVSEDGFTSRTNVWTGNKCVTYEDRRVISVEGVHDPEPPKLRPAERSRKDKLKNAVQAPLYAFGRVVDDTKSVLRKSAAGNLRSRDGDLKRRSMYATPTVDDEEKGSRTSKNGLMRSKSVISIKRNWSKRKSQFGSGEVTSGNTSRSSAIWRFARSMDKHERAISPDTQIELELEQQEIEQKQELHDDIGMEKPQAYQLAGNEDVSEQQETLVKEPMNASRRSESSELYEDLEAQDCWNGAGEMTYKEKAHNKDDWQGQDGTSEEKEISSTEAMLADEDITEHSHEVQILEKQLENLSDRMDEDKQAVPKTIPNNRSPTKHISSLTESFPDFDLHDFTPPDENLDAKFIYEYPQDNNYDKTRQSKPRSRNTRVCILNDTDSKSQDSNLQHFWAQPEAFDYHNEGDDPGYDNPYLHWDRHQELQEWTSTTEEYNPEHVYALTTAELKRLHGAAIKFDVVRTTYKIPVNTPAAYSTSHSEFGEESLIDDAEPQYNRKDLTKLLGVPDPQYNLEELLKADTHFHIVADWEPHGFDLDTNYSDYYGVPLFDPSPDTWLETPEGGQLWVVDSEESATEVSDAEHEEAEEDDSMRVGHTWSEMEGEDLRAQTWEHHEEDGYSLHRSERYAERVRWKSSAIYDNNGEEENDIRKYEDRNSIGAGFTEEYAGDYAEPNGDAVSERYSNDHDRHAETVGSNLDNRTSFTATEAEIDQEAFERYSHDVISPRIRARQRMEREKQSAAISVSSDDLESVSGSSASHESLLAGESTVSPTPSEHNEILRSETPASIRSRPFSSLAFSTRSLTPSFITSKFFTSGPISPQPNTPHRNYDTSFLTPIKEFPSPPPQRQRKPASRIFGKIFTKPVIKITKPRSNTLSSTTSTASFPNRTYPARPQVPAQSLILYLRGHGLSIHSIAVILAPLSAEFLYDSDSRWTNDLRIPEHPSFDDRLVERILETCDAGTPWWDDEYDDEGKPLPEGFRVLQRRMRVSKAEKLVKKCLENYFYWRFLRKVLHPTLMLG